MAQHSYIVATYVNKTGTPLDGGDKPELDMRVVASNMEAWEVSVEALRALHATHPASEGYTGHVARAVELTSEARARYSDGTSVPLRPLLDAYTVITLDGIASFEI